MANPKAPATKLMYAVMARLVDAGLPTQVNLPSLKLRWARNRFTTREERPCLAIAFVSDTPEAGGVTLSPDEMVMVLSLDLILDLKLETEAADETNAALATSLLDYDPSGLDDMMFVLRTASKLLRECTLDPLRDSTDLGRKVDWIEDVSVADDHELPDDDGRLVGRINVIYRASSWDPMVLLERSV